MLTSKLFLLLILQIHLGFMFAYLALQPLLGGRPSNVLILSSVCSLVVLVFGFVFYMVKRQREPDNESDNMPESAWKYLLQPGGSGVDGGKTFRLWLHAEFRECAQLVFCRASAATA